VTEARTDPDLLYVGTYTESTKSEGIYLVRMDRRSGELVRVGAVNAGANPSFLSIHPNRHALYAVNELDQTGAVSAFSIDKGSGALTRLNAQPSQGGAPCYVSVDRTGRAALIANYAGGNVALRSRRAAHWRRPQAWCSTRAGTMPERQAHARCILPIPQQRFALAANLGADQLFVYRLDLEGKSLRHV
jgi:6-phosphogluconolactonase